MEVIQILVIGYALGGIPFGVLLAKLFGLPDPRYIGSGNIGATNMLRMGNKKVALLTLLLDMGKGVAAVLLTNYLFPFLVRDLTATCQSVGGGLIPCAYTIANPHYGALAALLAAVGHMYSPWLKFKGGKGVATLCGGALAFSWPVGMAALLLWGIVVFTTRYVSLGSLVALTLAPFIVWLRVDGASAIILAIAAGIAIWKHRENIARLRRGFEPKVSLGKGK
ncbi:MAG: glycerol-3-phosphate 1-O-acyltransferase PlsY [Alphaproteobacteria bacterium]|nr:glycerol-3-phosphate 1-O-acyltransferase PlsY [Alphaproteobacteria bacterium]